MSGPKTLGCLASPARCAPNAPNPCQLLPCGPRRCLAPCLPRSRASPCPPPLAPHLLMGQPAGQATPNRTKPTRLRARSSHVFNLRSTLGASTASSSPVAGRRCHGCLGLGSTHVGGGVSGWRGAWAATRPCPKGMSAPGPNKFHTCTCLYTSSFS